MTQTRLAFGFCLFVLSAVPTFEQHPGLEVQVFIPAGMPIKLLVERDSSDSSIAKYVIKRIVPNDVRRATIVLAMLDHGNKIIDASVAYVTSDRLADPLTLATGDPQAAKLLVIVERLETVKGKWIPDNKEQQISMKALVEGGSEALPRGKFIEIH